MNADPTEPFLAAIRDSQILTPTQYEELNDWVQLQHPDPNELAREVNRRGWLTPFQIREIYKGRGIDLRLGPYLLLDLLGEGGMGRVYKAFHTRLGREVALKVIRKEKLSKSNALQRFQQEIRAVAHLSHPNVVLALDADEADGTPFYAMEFVEGTDLTKLVQHHGPIPFPIACEYIRQAAMGLQHAFERGLVHRDVKPSNLLVTPKGQVKVLDLGLAMLKEVPGSDVSGRVTQDGLVIGTPDFLAPEQAQNPAGVDIRADVYGLGATLYYLITGKVPFEGESPTDKLIKHITEPPPSLRVLRPEVPPALDMLVQAMMAKRPDDRPPTPMHVAYALAPFCLQTTPVMVHPGHPQSAVGLHPQQMPAAPVVGAVPGFPPPPPATHQVTPGYPPQSGTGYASSPAYPPQPPMMSVPNSGNPAGYLPSAAPYPGGLSDFTGGITPTAATTVRTPPREASSQRQSAAVRPAYQAQSDSGWLITLILVFLIGTAAIAAVGGLLFVFRDDLLSDPGELVERFDNPVGMTMILIRPGSFMMGSPESEEGHEPDEGPVAEVTLTQPFYISATEVTRSQFLQVTQRTHSRNKARNTTTTPEDSLTWDEAVEFCELLSRRDRDRRRGWVYRLPTEAEWEYACRAGTKTPFATGERFTHLKDVICKLLPDDPYAIADETRTETERNYVLVPYPAGSTRPNAFGLFDMHGNMWEWCQDYYAPYPSGPRVDPRGPNSGDWRVLRGGAWNEESIRCRSAARRHADPQTRDKNIGFRVVFAPK